MDSNTARALRKQTIYETRTDPHSLAVFRTWQDSYEWPLVPSLLKKENILIEKTLDRIVFMAVDDPEHLPEKIKELTKGLENYHIYLKE